MQQQSRLPSRFQSSFAAQYQSKFSEQHQIITQSANSTKLQHIKKQLTALLVMAVMTAHFLH
jgi:hypothetical protein